MITIEEQIWHQASLNPQKLAIKSGKDTVTYEELIQRIIASKQYFQSLSNYIKGSAVIIAANKQIEFIYAYFGAHMAGLIAVPIDSETNPTRFNHIINTVHPLCVIGFNKIETNLPKIALKEFKNLDIIYNTGENITFPQMNCIADILFTTGTTGTPKGVPLTYLNESAAVRNINTYIQNSSQDKELLALPVSHSFGLGRIRCCLANGQSIYLLGSFVNIKLLFKTLEEEHITGFSMVPASWKFLQKMSGNRLADFANQLRYIEMGSAYFSEEDKAELANLFPSTRVTMHYGLTEASRSAFLEFHKDKKALSSVGKASPFTEIKIFDENGSILNENQEGEICIKGEHVTSGYINQDNKDTFFHDYYFRTGDSGFIDSEGYIYLKSRIKELINVGGKKVAPTEVEELLNKIEGIEECACVGTKDPNGVLGEVVKAFIVRNDTTLTSEKITTILNGKLENYKIPVQYEWIDSIPKTNNGKILRNLLKTTQQ